MYIMLVMLILLISLININMLFKYLSNEIFVILIVLYERSCEMIDSN